MSKKSEIMKIWQECFPSNSPQWRRMFFDSAYSDEEALTSADPETGATVSSLLLLPYSMTFHGRSVGVAYVFGAATSRRFRAQGHMSRLMGRALREAADRGDTFLTVIPPSGSMRIYYRRFDLASVFFSRPMRYTSLHRFPVEGEYIELIDPSPMLLYPAFEQMMSRRRCCVQHTRAQFLTLMDDTRLCGHAFAAVAYPDGSVAAMVWAEPEMASNVMRVRELLSEDRDSACAALTALQRVCPGSPLTLMTQPADTEAGGDFIPGGMARVVNAESALKAVAAAHPHVRLSIRLRDNLLPENSGVYTLRNGDVTVTDDTPCKVDLDLTPSVLTAMLFSSQPIADITGLPACRPHMSLMLD